MTKKVKVHSCLKVNLSASIVDVSKLMTKKKERRVFVVDKEDHLLGIITSTDIVSKVVAKKKLGQKAKDIMVKKVSSIDISKPLENALAIMNKHQTFFCPILKDNKLLGVIQYHDLISFLFSEEREK
jgi:signal-transduction protein with cAMP-binding, CBS, and nucleotidyltransferase domain